jgi:hypothetical protein
LTSEKKQTARFASAANRFQIEQSKFPNGQQDNMEAEFEQLQG